MKHALYALLIVGLVLGGCAKNPAPVTPPTPTASAAKTIAILSSTNLATAKDVNAAMKSGLMTKEDGAKILSVNAQIDAACYQSALVLKSGQTPAQMYVALSAQFAAIVIPQFVDAKAQAEVTALAASVALVVTSIQALAH